MNSKFYAPVCSSFGTLYVVWGETVGTPIVYRIFLPREAQSIKQEMDKGFLNIKPLSCPIIDEFCKQIQYFLSGEHVDFQLDLIALEECSDFQKVVLLAEYQIPRGWVSTYGRIAAKVGVVSGARAVGNALSQNPFPIVIPCHRAIRSNGGLGGFQGGLLMKQTLLKYEGIEFSSTDKVLTSKMYY